ncbi:MAG: rhodanese [Rhodobacteraceae bacterium]|nr:MAG: rhodanese [Paracoccaceae bacterium]
MTAQSLTRLIAGLFIMLSLAFAHMAGTVDMSSVNWLWFTAFVGVNLFQSGLTNWCLMTKMLKKLGAA